MKRGVVAAVAVAAVAAAPASAGWGVSATGSGAAGAKSMPGGNTPTASVSGPAIAVTWSASAFGGGPTVEGYVVTRYPAVAGGAQVPGGSCAGTVTTTTCTDTGAITGTWTYTVTPVQGSWLGAESGRSNSVVKL